MSWPWNRPALQSHKHSRFFVLTWDAHDLDSHATVNEVSQSLPVLWTHVPEKPCYVNNQSHTRVLTQKCSNGLGAFPTGTPRQEPGDGAGDGRAILSFQSKFFYKIDFHMVGGVFAWVSPDLMACAPLDFIEQAGLFTELSGVKEDFKFPGFDSPPETQKALPCCHAIFRGVLEIISCSPLLSGRSTTWHLRTLLFFFFFYSIFQSYLGGSIWITRISLTSIVKRFFLIPVIWLPLFLYHYLVILNSGINVSLFLF